MASRYLRATGNWNGAVWAATSGGTAGSAATPTSSDDVYLYNYTVTLTADASCKSINGWSGPPMVTTGKVILGGYKLHIYSTISNLYNKGSTIIDASFSTLEVDGGITSDGEIDYTDSSLVLNISSNNTFTTYNKTFNDVRINMSGTGETINITGSPTFRLLDIRSANSAAHTVNFDDGADIYLDKFIAIGSSASNRLNINGDFMTMHLQGYTWSTYGQFVDINIDPSGSGTSTSAYIGSNSIGSGAWLFADPPKISTLVDLLTTAPSSNPNWEFPDGYPAMITSGIGGGGYDLTGAMLSTDTYDMVDSPCIFEQSMYGSRFIKSLIRSNYTVETSGSDDGVTWDGPTVSDIPDIAYYRSVRLGCANVDDDTPPLPGSAVGSINPSFAPANNASFLQFF